MSEAVRSGTLHSYSPTDGHGLKHDPFNAIIGPRPIGWISSRDKAGVRNLAPYSFFNAFNYKPPILGFSSIRWKDSVSNIAETSEFVWNLATRALATQMNLTAAHLPAGEDEFAAAGIEGVPSETMRPDRVADALVTMECKLTQILQLQSAAGDKVESWLVLGEVVRVHIDTCLLRDGVYDTAAARPILRAGRSGDYVEVVPEMMFEMPRPD